MVLQRWDPIRDFRRIDDGVNRFRRGFGGRYVAENGTDWPVPLDVVQEDDNIVVRASVPGASPENIDVSIDDGVLTIQARSREEAEREEGSYLIRERRSGAFRRSLRLPESVDSEKAESSYKDGVLTISLPKHEARKAKRLEVKAA